MRIVTLLFLIACCLMSSEKKIRYVALGDSYTVCIGGSHSEWPLLLADDLSNVGLPAQLVANGAGNGYGTMDLIAFGLPVVKKYSPDFVTLCIGANDCANGIHKEVFQGNLKFIIREIQQTLVDKNNLILIGIPDFGITPQGKLYGKGSNISESIQEFNAIIQSEARLNNLEYVDLFSLSQEMKWDPSLISSDGMHPSSAEYKKWGKKIFMVSRKLLSG